MMGSKSRMQGKVLPEPNTMAPVYAGIDVCKEWLDVYVPSSSAEAFASPTTAAAGDASTASSPRSA